MTDEEIVKDLTKLSLYTGFQEKHIQALNAALDLITRQQAEIERLLQKLQQSQSEAIKEFSNELIKTLKYALYGLDIKEKTISKEEVQKRFELLMHKDIPEVIEYVKNKMVGDEK